MKAARAFTLVELLAALLILALLGLLSYRGLSAVLDARDRVREETGKWQRVSAFFARFERDVQLAAARPFRTALGTAPAWRGTSQAEPRLEFTRLSSAEGADAPQRLAYHLNGRREIELWLWPGLDLPAGVAPARYPVLRGVSRLELHYLSPRLTWVDTWPERPLDAALPLAVRVRVVLTGNEDIVRVFALKS